MSLKQIHVVFITLCVGLMLLCATWALQAFQATGGWLSAVGGVGAVAGAALLVRYERGFLTRCRRAGL